MIRKIVSLNWLLPILFLPLYSIVIAQTRPRRNRSRNRYLYQTRWVCSRILPRKVPERI
jgi:hypothetical protein